MFSKLLAWLQRVDAREDALRQWLSAPSTPMPRELRSWCFSELERLEGGAPPDCTRSDEQLAHATLEALDGFRHDAKTW